MKRRTGIVLGIVASLGAATGLLAGTAGSAQAVGGTVPVKAYENVKVRSGPGTNYTYLFTFYAGDTLKAQCWDYGQTIRDNGVTNNVWIKLNSTRNMYVSAVYLKGNKHANVPWFCNH